VHLFLKHENLADGLCRCFLSLVLILCRAEIVWKSSRLFATKSIDENMYSYGRNKIFNFVSRFIHKFIGLSPAMINSSLCVHMYLMIINVSRSVLKPTQVLEQSQIYA
jgi:hypothetical protein